VNGFASSTHTIITYSTSFNLQESVALIYNFGPTSAPCPGDLVDHWGKNYLARLNMSVVSLSLARHAPQMEPVDADKPPGGRPLASEFGDILPLISGMFKRPKFSPWLPLM